MSMYVILEGNPASGKWQIAFSEFYTTFEDANADALDINRNLSASETGRKILPLAIARVEVITEIQPLCWARKEDSDGGAHRCGLSANHIGDHRAGRESWSKEAT